MGGEKEVERIPSRLLSTEPNARLGPTTLGSPPELKYQELDA